MESSPLGQEIKFRMICGKFREEMKKKKKRNLGEFSSNLCQGLHGARMGWWVCVWIASPFTSSDPRVAVHTPIRRQCGMVVQQRKQLANYTRDGAQKIHTLVSVDAR